MSREARMREDEIRPPALMQQFTDLMRAEARSLAERAGEFERVRCVFCGAAGTPALDRDGFSYERCEDCASLFASPRPTERLLTQWASQSEAVAFWSTHFYRQTAEARREKIFRPRATSILEYQQAGLVPPGPLVDIGAGYGLFLEEMAAVSPVAELFGVEPDHGLAEECRRKGFRAIEKRAEELQPGEVRASCVTAFEILEHVHAPLAFLRACRNAMGPDGVIVLTTLTISGFDALVLGPRWKQIAPPQHLNFPSLTGMRRLAEAAGLEITRLSTPGRLDVEIVLNAMNEDPAMDVPPAIRALVQTSPDARASLQAHLQAHHQSSHLRCVLRVPQ